MDYGPFGEQLSPATVVHKSYAGLFRDGEAGLDYAEARMYQPRTGRFNAPDSVYSGLFQPQAWNRYSYALNSPLTHTDPTGLQADPCLKSDRDIQEPASDDAGPIRVTVKCTSGDGGGGGGGGMMSLDMALWLSFGTTPPYGGAGNNEGSVSFDDFIKGFLSFAGSLVPPGGEILDGAVILDSDSTLLEQGLAGLSLGASVLTGGLSPNVGALRGLKPGAETLVIGKLGDLKNLGSTERSLLDRLPDRGSPQANWRQNAGVLRQEMALGQPIRDASVDASGALINNTGFLRAERNLLQAHGWTYNPRRGVWYPPR